MLGFFQPQPINDPTLGTLTRRGGWWVGTIALPRLGAVELRVAGSRREPDARSVELAATLPQLVSANDADIARELYEHYVPGWDAWQGGVFGERAEPFPEIKAADAVWPHVRGERVEVNAAQREFTIEIACAAAWDEEHTLGIRLDGGRVVELCGSIQ